MDGLNLWMKSEISEEVGCWKKEKEWLGAESSEMIPGVYCELRYWWNIWIFSAKNDMRELQKS